MRKKLRVLLLVVGLTIAIFIQTSCSNNEKANKTINYENDSSYIGEVKDGVPNGQGTLNEADGSVYIGQFKDGAKRIYLGKW